MFCWHWLGCGSDQHTHTEILVSLYSRRTVHGTHQADLRYQQETLFFIFLFFSPQQEKIPVLESLFCQVATKHAIHSLTTVYAVVWCMSLFLSPSLRHTHTHTLECGYQSINQSKQSRKLALPPILYKTIFFISKLSYFFILFSPHYLWLDGLMETDNSLTAVFCFSAADNIII